MNTARRRYVQGSALALATLLFLLFGIGALGIVGEGERDWMYLTAPGVALLLALGFRFRAHGMALALGAAAVTTLLVAVVAVVLVVRNDEGASLVDVVGISGMYALLFAGSAWLYRRSDLLA